MFADGNDNANANPNNVIFTIKDTKLNVPVLALSAKDNKKLSKFFIKGLERSVYWNEYKRKRENKNTTNEWRYFLESNSVGVNGLFVLPYLNWNIHVKQFKTQRYYLPKGIIENYNSIINGKNFYKDAIDSGMKKYKEIRKLRTEQHEDYTNGCLLGYD